MIYNSELPNNQNKTMEFETWQLKKTRAQNLWVAHLNLPKRLPTIFVSALKMARVCALFALMKNFQRHAQFIDG